MRTDPLALAAELVAVPSVSGAEGPYVDHLAARLAGMGFDVRWLTVEAGRDNLLALAGRPRVLFCTHTDTVPPHFGPRVEGDRLWGRGACDTKGLLASMICAAERLLDAGLVEFGFLLVVGEEAGHHGAKSAARLDLRPERIVLGEPTENRVVTAQKGAWRVSLRAAGVAAHSGYPELGISAVERLLDVLERARRRDWPVSKELGPTTMNIGRIGGGVADNVLAPSAEADLLFRAVGPVEELEAGLRECLVEGVQIGDTWGNGPFRYEAPPGYPTTVVAFNTDGPYLAALGPVVLAGPGTIRVAHTDHEHVDRADLEAGVALYESLALDVLGERGTP